MHIVRHLFNIMVVLGAILVFIGQKRYFPFSDYQMFSTLKKDLSFYTVILTKRNGEISAVANSSIAPLTKLHLHQMLAAISESKSDFYWVKDFFKNENSRLLYEKISVVKATYDYKSDRFTPYKVLYEADF